MNSNPKRTADLRAAMMKKYSGDGYAILWEVGNATGGHCHRHADALVMSLWPSRGLTLQGFELKCSRTDWLKELKDPEKADAIARYCHGWSVVVTDQKIIQPGELPATWGLWTLDENGELKLVKMATENQHQVPLDWRFMAAVLRQACNHEKSLTVEEKHNIERDVRNREQAAAKVVQAVLVKKVEEQAEMMRRFERETGLSITGRYNGMTNGQVAMALGAITKGAPEATQRLRELRHGAASIHRLLSEQVDAIEAMAVSVRVAVPQAVPDGAEPAAGPDDDNWG